MKTWLRLFFGLLVLVILIKILRKINFGEIYLLIIQANHLYFFLAFLAGMVSFFVVNLRSIYFMKGIIRPGFFFNLRVILAGFFVNNVTPGPQIGGDLIRAYFLGKKYKKSKIKLLGAILADRLFHLTVSLFFIVASVIYILMNIPISSELKIIFQTILFFIFFIFFIILMINFKKTSFDISWLFKKFKWMIPGNNRKNVKKEFERIVLKHFKKFIKSFRIVIRNKKILLVGVFLSLIYWFLIYAVSYFLFLSFGFHIRFFLVIVVVSLGELIRDFSPSPGGIGLVEGFTILAYSLIGINPPIAVAVSLLSRMIFYFFSLLLGGISLVQLEHSLK